MTMSVIDHQTNAVSQFMRTGRVLHRKGFSLIEMVVVIAIIGVIAAIALPGIGSISGASKAAVAQRNAQNMTSVFNSGMAAGVPDFIVCANVREAAAALNAGGAANSGPFSGKRFQCPLIQDINDMSIANEDRVLWYLGWDNGNLFYDRAGGHVN
jgi:prepilin-type N-terminal cleavage/methylation domain-containing protein